VECLAIFVGILIALMLLVGVGSGNRMRRGTLAAYRRVVGQYGGICERLGWSGYPRGRFSYGAAQVDLRIVERAPHRTVRVPVTQMTIGPLQLGFYCELVSPPFLSAEVPNVSIESDEFHRHYAIAASDADGAVDLLDPGMCWNIDRIRQLSSCSYLHVEFSQDRLRIHRADAIRTYAELSRFVQYALELYDRAAGSTAKGILFLDDGAAQPLGEVQCRVCGEAIRGALVYCRRCKTPHHRECWQYTGACSVYGCGEVQFEVPRVARRSGGAPPDKSA